MQRLPLRTGLRTGELLALRWTDVDLKNSRPTVRRAISRGMITTPKSGKSRDIPLSSVALAALRDHFHLRSDVVFCDNAGKLLTRGAMKWPLYSACKRAGLQRLGWHALRHSFASQLGMLNAPVPVTQALMGHSSIKTTMRYTHLSAESKRDAVQLLDSHVKTASKRPRKAG